jgi:hypothetical protein
VIVEIGGTRGGSHGRHPSAALRRRTWTPAACSTSACSASTAQWSGQGLIGVLNCTLAVKVLPLTL